MERKIYGILESEIERMAREHTNLWWVRPRAVKSKMAAIKQIAGGLCNLPSGQRHRATKALLRDVENE